MSSSEHNVTDPDGQSPNGLSDQQALNNLVVGCEEFRALELKLGKFNLFRVLRFEEAELRHSNMLAWLMDPTESHGLRDRFLRSFLMKIINEAQIVVPMDPVTVDSAQFLAVEVHREWQHIDVLVRINTGDETWAVVIENKINSIQSDGQLKGYRKKVENHFPRDKKVFVFLTLNPEEPDDDCYVTANYQQVHEVLDRCFREKATAIGPEPGMLIRNYLNLLKEAFMDDNEIAKLAKLIYSSHKQALDVIFRHRPDELAALTDELHERLKSEAKELKLKPMLKIKGMIRFIPLSWDSKNNRRKGNDAYVLCELNLWNKNPILKMYAGEVRDVSWTDELWRLSQSDEAPFELVQKRDNKPKTWITFHSVRYSSATMDSLLLDQNEETWDRVWLWLKTEVKSAGFNKVVDCVRKHIEELSEKEI